MWCSIKGVTKIPELCHSQKLVTLENTSLYLQPAIIRVAKAEQSHLISQVEGEKLVLGGDGRADSPGHCVKFGSYTLMDLKWHKIFHCSKYEY